MKIIKLTQNRETIVDDSTFAAVGHLKWFFAGGYAAKTSRWKGKPQRVFLHHIVAGRPIKGEIDHINRNSLDNQLKNLRIVSHRENLRNSSTRSDNAFGIRCISWHKRDRTWYVRFRNVYLGSFKTFAQAKKCLLQQETEHASEGE